MTLNHLECRELLTSLWDRRDGHCSPDRAQRVDAHLEACVRCYRLGEFQHRFFAALGELRGRWPAPAHLHDRVRTALAAERGGNSFSSRGLYQEAG